MRTQSSTCREAVCREPSPSSAPHLSTNGQVILDGFGIRVLVERGQLRLEDGLGDSRRTCTLSRATSNLKRLAIIGHTGTISLEALRWLSDVGAALTVIDKDGAVILAHGGLGRDDGKLRRAQAIAPYTGAHVPIIRYLLKAKLAGQRDNLTRFTSEEVAVSAIDSYREALDHSDTCETLRAYEANAANVYWETLANTPIRLGKRDVVPEHWRSFGGRASALTGNPRKASNPINAMLNYVYAILEAEASIAIRAIGMDPALGVLHADMSNRDSLACDVMEAVRPSVDAFILEFLASRTFSANQFHETREGVCRVLPPITATLAATAHLWARVLGPIVEHIAQAFMDASIPAFGSVGAMMPGTASRSTSRASKPLPTLLTQRKRSEGRDSVRVNAKRETPNVVTPTLFSVGCRTCGMTLPGSTRAYCDACLPERETEVFAAWKEAGPKALAGTNHGGDIGIKRGRTNAAHRKAMLEWEAVHGKEYNPTDFTTRILPTIQGVPVRKLAAVTGLSHMYCALVKRGERVPHPVQWDAFAQTVK